MVDVFRQRKLQATIRSCKAADCRQTATLQKDIAVKIGTLVAATAAAIVALVAGFAFYDEAVDPDIQEQLRTRQEVPDDRNLYLAMLGAGYASKEPFHVIGRRILEIPSSMEALVVGQTGASHYRELARYCNAIHKDRFSQWPAYRSCLVNMEGENKDGMTELVRQYLDLRGYPLFSTTIVSNETPIPGTRLWDMHIAFINERLIAGLVSNSSAELIEDVRFLRDALAKSDSLLVSVLLAIMLERDFHLVSEIIELGDRKRIGELQALYRPAPPVTAINIKGIRLSEYQTTQRSVWELRVKLMRGEDPLKEFSEMLGRPSPIPESKLGRWISALRLKPNATANNTYEIATEDYLPRTSPFREIHNATGSAYLRFFSLGYGYSEYLERFRDLDDYIRLIGLVGALSLDRTTFDPHKTAKEWAGKLSDSAGSSLRWDEKFWGFEFKPASRIWQEREKEAGIGVLVRVPPRLVPEVDAWQGYSARCAGARCELLKGNTKPLPARPGVRLSEVQDGMPAVKSVSENSHVSISVFDPDPLGDIVERIVRLQPSAAARADVR